MTLFFRHREGEYAEVFTTIDGSALAAIVLVGLTSASLLWQRRTFRVINRVKTTPYGLLIFFYCYCTLTAWWSLMPKYTLFRAGEVLSQLTAVVVAVSYCTDFRKAERTVFIVSGLTLLLAFFGQFRSLGFDVSIAALHTNLYSQIAAMLFCYSAGEVFSSAGARQRMLLVTGGFSLAALVAGTCASSNIGVVCGLVAVSLVGPALLRVLGAMVALGVGCAYLLLGWAGMITLFQGGLAPGKGAAGIEGMTGRVTIWEQILSQKEQLGWWGHGFSAATKLSDLNIVSAHNIVFDILMGGGIVGVVLIGIFLLGHYRRVFQTIQFNRTGGVGLLGASVAALINSLGSPVFGCDWTASTFVYACLLALSEFYGGPIPANRPSLGGGRSRIPRPQFPQPSLKRRAPGESQEG